MSRNHLIILVLCALGISACATSPEPEDVSSLRPGWMECPRMAPIGSKIKSKAVCSQQDKGRRVSSREEREVYRNDRDVLRNSGIPGGP